MNISSPDAGIPILTEVIDPTAAAAILPEIKPAAPAPAPVEQLNTDVYEMQATPNWDAQEWNRLERTIRERILRQIVARVDTALEQRVRDSLADVLQLAVADLAAEIRIGLHQSLDDMISRAVSQEITRLQMTKK